MTDEKSADVVEDGPDVDSLGHVRVLVGAVVGMKGVD